MIPELVIFDCDGVLIDSEIISTKMFVEALRELGIDIDAREAMRTYTGLNAASTSAEVKRRYGIELSHEFWSKKRARQNALFEAELKPVPGVADLLDRLPCKKCVGSSSSPPRLLQTLTITGLWDRLNPYVFSGDQVKNGKPAPDIFLFAARQMGVEPAKCLVIEDSIAGVHAGKAAKMRVFGFAGGGHCEPGFGDVLRKEGADEAFYSMSAIAEALQLSPLREAVNG